MNSLELTYIYHSGFSVETAGCFLVFDWWKDPAGVMEKVLASEKPLYVFSSHFHEDHFDREILSWKGQKKNITYILSKDILKHYRAKREQADVWMAKGGRWEDGIVSVTAAGSNDSGVSWIVETEGLRIFHAGDLNNWYSRFLTDDFTGGLVTSRETGKEVDPLREERMFLGELKDIAKITDFFDVAFFPVDGRIGNGYTKGGRQFIEKFHIGLFVPMHFTSSGFQSAWRMKQFTDEAGIPFWSISREGETLAAGYDAASGIHLLSQEPE